MKRKICGIEKRHWSMNGNEGDTLYIHVYDPQKKIIEGVSPESFKIRKDKDIDISKFHVNDTVDLFFDNWRNLDAIIKVQ